MPGPVTFDVGINPLWPGEKLPQGDPRWGEFNGAFRTEQHTPESLFNEVAKRGYAFSAALKGYRKAANFVGAQHLALDMDSGAPGLDSLLADDFISQYASFVYSTLSYTREAPRWRVVFVLPEPLTDPDVYRKAQTALLAHYGNTDQSIKDPARLLFGSNPQTGESRFLGNVLPMVEVLKLVGEYEDRRREMETTSNRRQLTAIDPAKIIGDTPNARYVSKAVQEEKAYLASRVKGTGDRHSGLLVMAAKLESLRLSEWLTPKARADIDPYTMVLEAAKSNGYLDEYGEQDTRRAIAWGIAPAEPRRVPEGWGNASAPAEPLDLAALLDTVATFFRQYVVLSARQACAQALWTAHAHAFAAAETTPYVSVRSVEKRSGKTRLLEVAELLVPKPLKAENISAAALVHSVAAGATLLLDEVDTIFSRGKPSDTQEALRGILDSGHRAGGSYVRMWGQGAHMSPRRFETFGPKMLAGIGKLPGTLDDRSIVIGLKRKTQGEKVEKFRLRTAREQAAQMKADLEGWAATAIEKLRDARSDIPEELDDRAADGWEPLLAIADMAGVNWPRVARDAALEMSAGIAREDDSLGVRLLADVRTAFGGAEKLPTASLLTALNAMDDSPWGGFGGGKGMTPRDLSGMLRRYGIRPKDIRLPSGSVVKGYQSNDFCDAWERYIPLPPQSSATSATDDTEPPDPNMKTAKNGVADTAQRSATDGGGSAPVADDFRPSANTKMPDVAHVADSGEGKAGKHKQNDGPALPGLTSSRGVYPNRGAL